MRLVARSTLVWILVYVLVLAVVGTWLTKRVRTTLDAMMEESSRLVAMQLVAALREPVMDELLDHGRARARRLREILGTTQEHSGLILSIVVVGPRGEVIASDNEAMAERTFPPPAELFGELREPRFMDLREPGSQVIAIPLSSKGEMHGYLRLRLQSHELSKVYQGYYLSLVISAIVGLVTIIGMGLALQAELRRSMRKLKGVFNGIADGRPDVLPATRNDLGELHDTAYRLAGTVQDARADLRTLATLLEAGILGLDEDGIVRYADESASALLGLDDPDHRSEREQGVRALLRPLLDRARAEPLQVHRIDGTFEGHDTQRRLSFTVHMPNKDGPRRYLVVVRDAELLGAIERDLREASRFRALIAVYAGVAHDLRAPLNALALNLELMQRHMRRWDVPESQREPAEKAVDVMQRQLDRLNRLLLVVLEKSVESPPEAEDVDLREVIDTVVQLIATSVRKRGIRLEVDPGERPAVVRGHTDQLQQVLINLAINACEAMSDDGQLTIRVEAADDEARVIVSDTGVGIPSTLLRSVFDMHFSTKETGTGIGLYVAKQIIEQHGGTLVVASELGHGAAFTVTLPCG